MGLEAVEAFRKDFAPRVEVVWVGADLHDAGLDFLPERRLRDLSLVDGVSFLVMWRRRLDEAFAFDDQFRDEGFTRLN